MLISPGYSSFVCQVLCKCCSHSVCLFTLLIAYFACRSFWVCSGPMCSVLLLQPMDCGSYPRSHRLYLRFLPENLVLGVWSLIFLGYNFRFVRVKGMDLILFLYRYKSNFIPHHLKRLSVFCYIVWMLLSKTSRLYISRLISGLSILFYVSIFMYLFVFLNASMIQLGFLSPESIIN